MRLGDVCEVVGGATPKTSEPAYWDGGIKWVTPAEISDNTYILEDTAKHLTEAGFRSASLHMMPAGTVLLTTRAPIGKVALAGAEMCCNQGFKCLVCSDAVSNEWLYRYLKHRAPQLQTMGTGATFKELSKRAIANLEIVLPSLDDQLAAVHKLASVEQVMAILGQQFAKLDELAKSRFVEMFGDADALMSRWPKMPLVACVNSIDSGKSVNCKSEARTGSAPGVLKLSALSSGKYLPEENKAMFDGESVLPGKEVVIGDILVARKNTPDLVGACVMVDCDAPNLMFPDLVFRIHPIAGVDGTYLSILLGQSSFSETVRSLAHGSAKSMSNIPKSELGKLEIPFPPLALQREFADFAARVDKLRVEAQTQKEKLQMLYDSLAQDYFAI